MGVNTRVRRHKAHKPKRRIPRYPALKELGYKRRRAKRWFATSRASTVAERQAAKRQELTMQRAVTASGLYTARLERGGDCPDWLTSEVTGIGSLRGLHVNNLTQGDSVVILERTKPAGTEYSYRTWRYELILDTYYAVMPLSYAYWRMQAVKNMLAITTSPWSELCKSGAYGYMIVLPEAGVVITKYLPQAQQARMQMLEQIAALR